MLSMDENKYLHVGFLNINTLLVTHQVKNLDIHKLLIGFWVSIILLLFVIQ
jgi:hypothetical protein